MVASGVAVSEFTATAVVVGEMLSSSLGGVRSHFDVTGIPKGKARGTLVTSSGTLEAH